MRSVESMRNQMMGMCRIVPGHLGRGSSTAVSTNVNYRLGKLQERDLFHGTWLDCGCADGGYTVAMINRGVERAVGVDVEEERVLVAKRRELSSAPVHYACTFSESLPFADASFDGVLLNEVLEHVMDEVATLQEIHRVLCPGGYLALFSPNRWFPFEGHGMRLGKRGIPFPVPFLPWIPGKFVIRLMCARNYWPGELQDMVQTAGFEVLSTSSVLPVFEVYPWLPERIIHWYRLAIPVLETIPIIRHFGVSTFVLAQRPLPESRLKPLAGLHEGV